MLALKSVHTKKTGFEIICPSVVVNISISLHDYKHLRFDPILIHD